MKSDFGIQVDMLQAEKDISLDELAKRVGKSKQCVVGIKRSKRPRATTIHRFAKALEVEVRRFFDL